MMSRFPRRADAVLFVALSLVTAALSAAAVVGSLASVGRTFPGFVVWDNLFVVPLGRPNWTGIAADVPFRARVKSVDGRTVTSRRDLEALVGTTPAGTPHEYVFERPGEREHHTIPSMVFTPWDYLATLGVYALNGFAFLAVGLAVFYLKPESRQSRALLAFGVVWGLYLLLDLDLFTAGRFGGLAFLLEALAPAAILHLALTVPEPRPPLTRSGWPLVWLYAVSVAAGLAQLWLFGHAYRALLFLNTVVFLAIAGTSLVGMASLALAAAHGRTPLARRRARVVLTGTIVAFLVPVIGLLAFFVFGRPVSFNLLTLSGFLFPLSIGYAIARHDLFEADRFVKQALVYAVITALVSLAYAGALLLANGLAAGLVSAQSPVFPIAFVLVALATVVPLRDRVQRAVDRLFYRGRVDYKETVARASERLTTLLDRDAVVQHLLTALREVLFIDGATLWERDDEALVRRGGRTTLRSIPASQPGLVVFEARGSVVSRDEVEESTRLRRHRDALRALFDALEATLLVPLLRRGRPAGLLAVGGKASGRPFSADDVDVLSTLANQTAIALANAAALEQLREAQESLARAERLAAIGELSAAVAHGIRNPLAGIRLAAQLALEHTAPDSPVHENLEDVLVEVDKLEAHVRGILDFTRPFEPHLEPTHLPALVGALLRTLAPRLEAGGVTVEVDVPGDVPLVRADPTHLGQVLQELVVNAIEAMGPGGRITISAAASSNGHGGVRIDVSDTGPGVPPEMRQRIFQLFLTTKSTGTGVGLAVVRKIIERHGGTIAVEQGAPRGARFVIELPAA
ncbi:MAG: GAF domain-containing protein [Deltaproteobacteria bacterium]|nr:MAG: GAF domain-containing protein [Deltaproteobacteria bacterium]